MAQPEDQDIEYTRLEAERRLRELDNSTFRGSSDHSSSSNAGVAREPLLPATQVRPFPTAWLVLAALVFGSVVSAFALVLLFKSPDRPRTQLAGSASSRVAAPQQPTQNTQPPASPTLPSPPSTSHSSSPTPSPPSPSPSTPSPPLPREVPSKGRDPAFQAPNPAAPSTGAWGAASDYKFGRLPDSTFPDSCAFSRTDPVGQTITSYANVDYWACRDEGGNATDGFTVAWSDAKRTKYTFGPGGVGAVVGTNGQTYPIKWRNDHRNGSKVIIISHSDGATSWIPGQVN